MTPDTKAAIAGDLKDGIELLKTGKATDQRIISEMVRKERIVFTLDLPESNDSIGAAMSLTIKKDETKEDLKPMVERSMKFFTANGKQKILSGPGEENLGMLKVVVFSLSMEINGGTVFSNIYCAKRNGYLLTFSISYADRKGFTEMETVLKGIEII